MPKLRLKRTPEEEAAHQFRKRQRKEAKRKRKQNSLNDSPGPFHNKHTESQPWASNDDEFCGRDSFAPQNHNPGSTKIDYDALRNEIEEQRFRDKMFAALADDERLDSVEARFNDFAHIPDRWRSSGSGRKPVYNDDEEYQNIDPRYMDDEEYAEWIRVGMFRKTDEYAEQQRKKALHAHRREEEKARRLETQRLEKAAELKRHQKKTEKEERGRQYARGEYEIRWKMLLADHNDVGKAHSELRFHDIPWPVLAAYRQRRDKREPISGQPSVSLECLTQDAISEFLLPPFKLHWASNPTEQETEKKERKEKLRETFLRFHPDKFEGRFMKLVRESERGAVREAIGQVVRSLNTLMNDKT